MDVSVAIYGIEDVISRSLQLSSIRKVLLMRSMLMWNIEKNGYGRP